MSRTAQTAGEVLVIGYGNELRGDDAVGVRVAEAVQSWQLPGVQALAVPQLTPELSEPIAAAHRVIFVDATTEPGLSEVQCRTIDAAQLASGGSHHSDPGTLLALARTLFGRAPTACLLAIPVSRFDYGAPLSPLARRGLEAALEQLRHLCGARPLGE